MTTIQTAKEKEPIFFILADANTYFRAELVEDRLIVTCANFAWGPQRISIEWTGRNELELGSVVTRNTMGVSGFIRREIGPHDAVPARSLTASEAAIIETPLMREIERLRAALRRIADLSVDLSTARIAHVATKIAREALESARGGQGDGKA